MITVLNGHALAKLKELPDESAQCCVSSPPYWGLRDYGTPPQIWGGESSCDHEWSFRRYYMEKTAAQSSGGAFSKPGQANADRLKKGRWREDNTCLKCGAWLGSLGLEPTPELFVANIAEVFREVRRVLRKDGTCWINLGDSYANTNKGHNSNGFGGLNGSNDKNKAMSAPNRNVPIPDGLKTKDLVGIPWRVAFALQADGWYLRSDIIWHKPNPMPESVTDRPTKAHEYIFLLTKSEKYFYDHEAIKEPAICGARGSEFHTGKTGQHQLGRAQKVRPSKVRGDFNGKTEAMPGRESFRAVVETRNKRTVWTVSTKPYKEAHFATFPPALIEPCILAGSRAGDTVLDPFGGSGTTGQVALKFGRKAILIELNPSYIPLIKQRTSVTPRLL